MQVSLHTAHIYIFYFITHWCSRTLLYMNETGWVRGLWWVSHSIHDNLLHAYILYATDSFYSWDCVRTMLLWKKYCVHFIRALYCIVSYQSEVTAVPRVFHFINGYKIATMYWLAKAGLRSHTLPHLPLTLGGAPHPAASSTATVRSQQWPELPKELRSDATKMIPVVASIPNRPAHPSLVILHTSWELAPKSGSKAASDMTWVAWVWSVAWKGECSATTRR